MNPQRLLSIAMVCLMAACMGCGGETAVSKPVVTVAVSPASVTLDPGGKQQFTATVSNAVNTSVAWSVQEGTNGGTIDGAGLYTAPSAGGTFHVIATSMADTSKSTTGTVTVRPPNPVPTLTSLSPASVQTGAAGTLTVTGTNFIATSVIRWNGADRTTTFVSSTQLTTVMSASDVANAATVAITVFNAAPGGGLSGASSLTIAGPPMPAIAALSPSSRQIGLPAFTLSVTGSNFASGSIVRWNGSDRATTYVSSTQLQAAITTADAASAGVVTITVFNPDAGGGAVTSLPVSFSVTNPVPYIASLMPSSATVGSSGFTLIVNGSDFVAGSVVRWNATDRPTTFANSTLLSTNIAASDVATAATALVTVFNPGPGGGTSPSVALTIAAPKPVPAITSLTPASVFAGSAGITVAIDGTGFTPNSIVERNSVGINSTYVGSTRLTFALSATDVSDGGVLSFTVFNPAPGGGLSAPATFTINNPAPVVTALTPSNAIAGDAPIVVSVNGSGFTKSSVVQWNGTPRTTSWTSSSVLTATVSTADLVAAGTAQISVASPQPGGGTSAALPFTIATRTGTPQPTLVSLDNTSAPAGWPGMSLGVTGTGFVAGTVLQFDTASRPTFVISSTRLEAAIDLADLVQSRTAQVTVSNPSPGGGVSVGVPFTIAPVAANARGVSDFISKNGDFQAASGGAWDASISPDGRFVAFTTTASNLLPTSRNITAVYQRDTCRGAAAGCVPGLERVSQNTAGVEADSDCSSPAVSAGGRYVAFQSSATNLGGGRGIYVRDTCHSAPPGCTPSTSFVTALAADYASFLTISADGAYLGYAATNSTNGSTAIRVTRTCLGASAACVAAEVVFVDNAREPRLSNNGRYLVFTSSAEGLVQNDTNAIDDIFLYDLCSGVTTGCTPGVQRVSLDSNGVQSDGSSFLPAVSSDGRFVVFSSWASNLVPEDAGVGHQVYLRDTCLGAPAGCVPSTQRISVSDSGTQVRSGGPATGGGRVSDDGRYVVFGSNRSGLVANMSGFQLYLRDTCVGGPSDCKTTTRGLSIALDGTIGNGSSTGPSLSSDGRSVGFVSDSTNLGPGTGKQGQVYLANTGRQ